jgi:hypothetical protein
MAVSDFVIPLSRLALTASQVLYEYDRAAHEEAVQNGGVCPVVLFSTQDFRADVFSYFF